MKVLRFLTLLLPILLAACAPSGVVVQPTASPASTQVTAAPTSSTTRLPEATSTATPDILPVDMMVPCHLGGEELYLVIAAERRHIIDGDTFEHLGFQQGATTPCGEFATYPEGPPLTRLLKGAGEDIYWMQQGLRHLIPDMATFHALGYREEMISEVPEGVLVFWDRGEPLQVPTPTVLSTALSTTLPTPPPAASAPPESALRQKLLAIHNQFEYDPARRCFDLPSPAEDYRRALRQMTAILVTDPLAQSLTLEERIALFEETSTFGLFYVAFYPGESGAMLVSLRPIQCHARYEPGHNFHVVDEQGGIWPIDPEIYGIYRGHWWLGDRWAVLLRLKMDSSSGPTGWAIFWVGEVDHPTGWGPVLYHQFNPSPYNDYGSEPELRFEEGTHNMVADLRYWQNTDPCLFNESFYERYDHSGWGATERYEVQGGSYVRTDFQVRDFIVYTKGTQEAVEVDWQSYCTGPLEPRERVQ